MQFVSPAGSDTSGGSLGAPKATILAAYNALPAAGGSVLVMGSGAQCSPTSGQGFGIAGSGDPNYASMPEVLSGVQWVRAKTGAVVIQGISAISGPQNSVQGWGTPINCGNASTPGLWLSGITGMTISRITLRTAQIPIRVSIDSNGGRSNSSNLTTDVVLDHDDFFTVSGGGPTLDAGGGLTWFHVNDSELENGGDQAVTANSASNAYFSNGNAASALGLIYFDHVFFTGGGGVRYDSCTGSSGSFYMQRSLMEGSGNSQPLYEVTNNCGGVSSNLIVEGGTSDSGNAGPIVRVTAGIDPCLTNVSGIVFGGAYAELEGPMTVGAGTCSPSTSGGTPTFGNLTPLANVTPAAKYQRNGQFGISVNDESYRRSFSPGFVRFTNLAAQSPASWVANLGTGESLTQIQGPGDPSGVTNAATLNCTANGVQGGCDYTAYNANQVLVVGDYLYIGVWAQSASTAGFASSGNGPFDTPIGLEFPFTGPIVRILGGGPSAATGNANFSSRAYYQTDGNWQWTWALAKITGGTLGNTNIKIHLAFKTGFPINAYAPMFVRIPASSVALVAAPTFSSASESVNTVTFTTTGAHNLYGAMPVVISGCSVSGYNGEWVISGTPTAATFTLYNPTSGLGAPTGCVITPGNDSEMADWANNLSSYGDNCTLGTFCGIRGVSVPKIIASGTSTLGNSLIGSGACATLVTSTAAGAITSDRIEWDYASAPATADGLLTLSAYPTAGNVNFKLCNPTAGSQTPSGLVVNWGILR